MLLPAVHTWAEWGQMFTDVEQWAPTVREICTREAIPCREIEAGYPGTNAVYIVDRTYVVKVYAPFCHEDYELECDLYPILARDPQVPAPRLLARGVWKDRIDWPYIVMDYLPGQPIGEVRDDISPSSHVEIALGLACILRSLHATPLDAIQALDSSGRDWRRFVHSRRTAFVQQLRQEKVLCPEVIDQCAAWIESVWDDVQAEPLVLLNGDVTEDHVLVQRQDGVWRISGLIDYADALIGQAEYEWIALWFGALDRKGASMRAFLERYDASMVLDERFLKRVMAYTLLHEFGAGIIRWVLERTGNPPIRSCEELQDVLWGSLFKRGGEDVWPDR